MPESHLWLINHLGSVFTLGTSHHKFQQLANSWIDGVNVKRLSASRWCAWAIGHDHRVYIYVRSSDVPIRVPETTFENQRWSPIHGFSKSSLIKTDRPAWSNEAGTVDRPKESVRLPSAHWEWENDWLIDDNLRGEVVGIEGWQYAFDFPAIYTPEKHWNSFVRKRKWIRFRRFSSTDIWARISDAEVVERTECFIDISIGGFLMPSQPPGFLSVWAITNNGHVYVRTDVRHDNPEGSTWQELALSDNLGIINISVGATNLVWAVTWDGSMVVRSEVTRNNVYGSSWIVVDHPDNSSRFMQVSVGRNAVWAVSREGKVWFRKGTSGDDIFWNQESAVGTSWVEMVGEMLLVAVSSNDQVFAIDLSGKTIYFRTGVTAVDLTGKTWQAISLQEDLEYLEKQGLLSEGDICSCSDPDVPCGLHKETRPRLSSTTTTTSSISTTTNAEESSDGFVSPLQPYQPFPDYSSEICTFDLPALSHWKQSQLKAADSDQSFLNQPHTRKISHSHMDSNLSSSHLHSYTTDKINIAHEKSEKQLEIVASLQQSVAYGFQTVKLSTSSQTFILSEDSFSEETFDQLEATLVSSSNEVSANHTLTENTPDTMPLDDDDESGKLALILSVTESEISECCCSEGKVSKISESSNIEDKVSEISELSHPINKVSEISKLSHPNNKVSEISELSHTKHKVSAGSNRCIDQIISVIGASSMVNNSSKPFEKADVESREDNMKMKPTSCLHMLDTAQSTFSCSKASDDKILTEFVDNDCHVHQGSNVLERTMKATESNDDATFFAHATTRTPQLITQLPDKQSYTPKVNEDIFKTDNSSRSNSVEIISKSMEPTKVNSVAVEMDTLSVDGDNSLFVSSTVDTTHSLVKNISNQCDNKQLVSHKRRSKERRPKVINVSFNDPSDDSVLFKTYKTRKKRQRKSVNSLVDKNEKTDTISVSSDTSQSLTDVVDKNQQIQTNREADFTDAHVYESYLNDSESRYQSLSADGSYQPSAYPGLSILYGEYLSTVGIATESVHTLLTELETAETHLMQPLNLETPNSVNQKHDLSDPVCRLDRVTVSGLDIVRDNVREIVSSSTDSSRPVDPSKDKSNIKPSHSAKHKIGSGVVKVERNSKDPKPVILASVNESHAIVDMSRSSGGSQVTEAIIIPSDSDSLTHISLSLHKQLSNGPEGVQITKVFQPDVIDFVHVNSIQQCNDVITSLDETVQMHPTVHIISNGGRDKEDIPGKNISDAHIAHEHTTVDISHLYETARYIPMQKNEYNAQFSSSAANIKVESKDMEEIGCSDNHSLHICVSGSERNIGKSAVSQKSTVPSEQFLKIEEFADKKFTSLDSTSTSEEMYDFATDLLVSEDETLEKKIDTPQSYSQNMSEGDVPHEVAQLQTTVGAMGSSVQTFHSQLSIRSSRSSGSGMSSMTRDSSEDSEVIDNTIPHSAPAPAHSTNAAMHPRTLSFGSSASGKKPSRYFRNTPPSQVPTADVIPIVSLTVAQPRLCWRWLDATSCVIDDPATVAWLSFASKESETKKKSVKIMKQLREDVLKKLQERNKREVHRFRNIEQAIRQTTWVKKVNMQMYLYGGKSRWIPCSVELEQGITNLSEGCLTVHYQQKRKQKNIQIQLSEMICVKPSSDPDNPCGFVVYTPATNTIHQPLMLKANSESEAVDWMGSLSVANAAVWGMNSPLVSGAIWSCTFSGDVFISPFAAASKSPAELCWSQHGGHMRLIETGSNGVTWALGFDKMPYVYNGGYGGAFNTGMSDVSENTQQIVDHHRVFVYENQKWFPVIGWCCKGVFHNDFHWLTEFGRSVETKENVKLPSSKCQWVGDWTVDFSTPGGVDAHGWQYSSNLYGPFYPRQHLRSSYRRRRWVRQYKITVFGPWHAAGSLGLVDLSIQIDPLTSISDPVILWAVGGNGDVLCRYGVTASSPKGQSWIHVATDLDKPFKSISVGGSYRVWGIAGDGSAWFRPGVNPLNHTGTCWLQVVPPPQGNFLLHQVSAGATSVWAVDTGDNLWRRENITPTFPEGTGWELIASQVKRVSVGPRDQVWIVADACFSKTKNGPGFIYRRRGITSSKPSGTDWEAVIGSGWSHVSVRGVSEIKQEDNVSTAEENDGSSLR